VTADLRRPCITRQLPVAAFYLLAVLVTVRPITYGAFNRRISSFFSYAGPLFAAVHSVDNDLNTSRLVGLNSANPLHIPRNVIEPGATRSFYCFYATTVSEQSDLYSSRISAFRRTQSDRPTKALINLRVNG
jgi:hypothetical protein